MRGRRLAISGFVAFSFISPVFAGCLERSMIRIFDTHVHYDDAAFDSDREEVLASLKDSGVLRVTDIGAGIASSKTALELSRRYPWMYCALGVIPGQCSELNDETWEWLQAAAAREDKCVAIGEIGLDYHWDDDPADVQKEWFSRQLRLAAEVSKPVVIHSREAARDTIDIMKAEHAGDIGGVMHCYSYTKETARELLEMDFFFGIGGVVTFKNARKLVEAVEYIPLSNLVLETDCPYLAPVPHRGERNTSAYLGLVADRIAEIRKISTEEVLEAAWHNAHRLYKIAET